MTPTGAIDSAGRAATSTVPSDPTSATAAANTAVVTTYAAVAGQRHRLTLLDASYSAAPAGARVLVQDGAATVYDHDYGATQPSSVPIPPGGIQGSVNTQMVVTLAAGGAGVTGKLNTAKMTY